MDQIKPLFTATATATGGRNGHTEANDGSSAMAGGVRPVSPQAARDERPVPAPGGVGLTIH